MLSDEQTGRRKRFASAGMISKKETLATMIFLRIGLERGVQPSGMYRVGG